VVEARTQHTAQDSDGWLFVHSSTPPEGLGVGPLVDYILSYFVMFFICYEKVQTHNKVDGKV
jgi:hypothetical protein